jgi:hypothetical protein
VQCYVQHGVVREEQAQTQSVLSLRQQCWDWLAVTIKCDTLTFTVAIAWSSCECYHREGAMGRAASCCGVKTSKSQVFRY